MKIASLLLVTAFAFSSAANVGNKSPFGINNVVLKSFTVTTIDDGRTAKLVWELAEMEHDVTCFVERSEDGKKFTTVATLKIDKGFYGIQNSIDKPSREGLYYYRLHMVKSGFVPFTSIVAAIRIEESASAAMAFRVSNPVKNQITIRGKFSKNPMKVELADMNGQIRLVKRVEASSAGESISFATGNLGKGIYLVRVSEENNGAMQLVLVKRIIKSDE